MSQTNIQPKTEGYSENHEQSYGGPKRTETSSATWPFRQTYASPHPIALPEFDTHRSRYKSDIVGGATVSVYQSATDLRKKLEAIPVSRHSEMIKAFDKAVATKSAAIIIHQIARWYMIGHHYSVDPQYAPSPKFGSAKGLLSVSEDYDDPVDFNL